VCEHCGGAPCKIASHSVSTARRHKPSWISGYRKELDILTIQAIGSGSRRDVRMVNYGVVVPKPGPKCAERRGDDRQPASDEDKFEHVFSRQEVYDMLQAIKRANTGHDFVGELGFEPTDFMLSAILVAPPCVRPVTVNSQGGVKKVCEHDFNSFYRQIIAANIEVSQNLMLGSAWPKLKQKIDALQRSVDAFLWLDANHAGKHHSGTERCNMRRLFQKGKRGFMRLYVQGKRQDRSARTVLSCRSFGRIDDIYVPRQIANALTKRLTVNVYNYRQIIRDYHDEDKIRYIKFADRRLGSMHPSSRDDYHLAYGDEVDVNLSDGDVVLFNRQPSLHKGSTIALTARIWDEKTFGIHPALTPPPNADFDGDEGNIHVPVNVETESELKEIGNAGNAIFRTHTGAASIAPIQDAIVGLYVLTDEGRNLRFEEALDLTSALDDCWTLPPGNCVRPWRIVRLAVPPDCRRAVMRNLKRNYGAEPRLTKGIIKYMVRLVYTYGGSDWRLCLRFIEALCRLGETYAQTHGLTAGLGTVIRGFYGCYGSATSIRAQKTKIRAHARRRAHGRPGTFELPRDALQMQNIHEKTGELPGTMMDIVLSGSKSSKFNMRQMFGTVGRQGNACAIRAFGGRVYPHMAPCADPRQYRETYNSLLTGLDPHEFFDHAISGRTDRVRSAITTGTEGYRHRRLVETCKDLIAQYDGTVRNEYKSVTQFCSYGDGFAPEHSCYKLNYKIPARAENEDDVRGTITSPVNYVQVLKDFGASNVKVHEHENASGVVEQMTAQRERIISYNGLDAEYRRHHARIFRHVFNETAFRKCTRMSIYRCFDVIERALRGASVPAGESVGCITMQSIGEIATQGTLDSFHTTGTTDDRHQASKLALDRVLDNSVKDRGGVTIYVKEGYTTAELYAHITEDRVQDIVKAVEVYVRSAAVDALVPVYVSHAGGRLLRTISLDDPGLRPESGYTVVFHMKNLTRLARKITHGRAFAMETWASVIAAMYLGPLIKEVFGGDAEVRRVLPEDHANMERYGFCEDSHWISIKVHVSDELAESRVVKQIDAFLEASIAGIRGLRNGEVLERMIIFESTANSTTVADLMMYEGLGLDWRRSFFHSGAVAQREFGIEAQCASAKAFLEMTIDRGTLSTKHLDLLIDNMSKTGTFHPPRRFNMEGGTLKRAAFEAGHSIFCEAAAEHRPEQPRSINEQIALGKAINGGTGFNFDLLLSVDALHARFRKDVDLALLYQELNMKYKSNRPWDDEYPKFRDATEEYVPDYPYVEDATVPLDPLDADMLLQPLGSDFGAAGFQDWDLHEYNYEDHREGGCCPTSPGYCPASPTYNPRHSPREVDIGSNSPSYRSPSDDAVVHRPWSPPSPQTRVI